MFFFKHFVGVLEGDLRAATEHACDFTGAGVGIEQAHFGVGPAILNTFGNGEMGGSAGGHLRQMRNADELVAFGHLRELAPYRPANFAADVDFNSLSGDFETDFDMSVTRERSKWIGSSIEGTIGGGGQDLSFSTVSGDVNLRVRR